MEIVSNFRRELAERLGGERYDLWFGSSVDFQWREGKVTLIVGDQFLLDRIKLRFRPDLQEVCRNLLGETGALDFQVASADRARSFSTNRPSGTPEAPHVAAPHVAAPHVAAPHVAAPQAAAVPGAPLHRSADIVRRAPAADRGNVSRRRFHTLDSFVVGDGNRVAHTAAQMVLGRLGSISPLLIYGPNGCGKTHLLESMLMQARQRGVVKRSIMISAEQFTTHFLESLQGSGLPNFRRKYRDVELLLIDDVQFFAGKRATLVELQHTLDTLLRAGKQVVFTADRSPVNLQPLGTELVTRMSGGLVCGIDLAEYETRLGIARRAAAERSIVIPDEVLELIAGESSGDARQIFGAMNRLEAAQQAHQVPLTVEFAGEQLADLFQAGRRLVRLPDIEQAICEVYGLDPNSLRNEGKSRELNEPRMLAMWLARRYTRAAFSEIGQFFGRRSHSSVIAAQKRVGSLLESKTLTRIARAPVPLEDVLRRIEYRLRIG